MFDDELIKRILGSSRPWGPKTTKLTSLIPSFPLSVPPPPNIPPPKLTPISQPRPIQTLKKRPSLALSRIRVRAAMRRGATGEITVGRLLPDPDTLGLAEGRLLRAALLYADLRGFSSMVAVSPKRSALVVLDTFISEMARIASAFNGELVDCAGDRILAVFSRPFLDGTTKPIQDAVTCALWMQTVMTKVIVPKLGTRGYPALSCGIGLDYGDVVVARIGIRNRNKLVFLGYPAVSAAKLEENAEGGETVLSSTVYSSRPPYLNESNGWIVRAEPPGGVHQIYRISQIFLHDTPPI